MFADATLWTLILIHMCGELSHSPKAECPVKDRGGHNPGLWIELLSTSQRKTTCLSLCLIKGQTGVNCVLKAGSVFSQLGNPGPPGMLLFFCSTCIFITFSCDSIRHTAGCSRFPHSLSHSWIGDWFWKKAPEGSPAEVLHLFLVAQTSNLTIQEHFLWMVTTWRGRICRVLSVRPGTHDLISLRPRFFFFFFFFRFFIKGKLRKGQDAVDNQESVRGNLGALPWVLRERTSGEDQGHRELGPLRLSPAGDQKTHWKSHTGSVFSHPGGD